MKIVARMKNLDKITQNLARRTADRQRAKMARQFSRISQMAHAAERIMQDKGRRS